MSIEKNADFKLRHDRPPLRIGSDWHSKQTKSIIITALTITELDQYDLPEVTIILTHKTHHDIIVNFPKQQQIRTLVSQSSMSSKASPYRIPTIRPLRFSMGKFY